MNASLYSSAMEDGSCGKKTRMENTDCTMIILSRLQKLDPENANMILGYLLLKNCQQEMIDCATGPDSLIYALISEAKACLACPVNSVAPISMQPHFDQSIPARYMPASSIVPRQFSSSSSFRVAVPGPFYDSYDASAQQQIVPNLFLTHPLFSDLNGKNLCVRNQSGLFGLEEPYASNPLSPEFSSSYLYPEAALTGSFGLRNDLRSSPKTQEYPSKVCHYYNRGYCRNGNNCRYFHGQDISDGISQLHGSDINETVNEDHAFAPGTLEKLEMEIRELLKMRKGIPISIASLPMLYQEKYNRPLQADGYLTESQRHGKTGCSLTKLLGRLKNGIRLIDRPHGQHSLVLSEDAPRYMDLRNEKIDLLEAAASSCQIYLTFPADSTFSEEDVLKYFNQFGPVRDVRIPRQEKRMFGFVSFLYPETVRLIFSKGIPHFICGSRILVKPYKEKLKLTDRRFAERVEHPTYNPSQYFETDPASPESNAIPRLFNKSKYSSWQHVEEHEQALEQESKRLLKLQINPAMQAHYSLFGHNQENFKLSEDNLISPAISQSPGTAIDYRASPTSNNHNDHDFDHIELPDSPFGSLHQEIM
ncbi:hypothetical protein J5N97_010472 [Dioscorea zingiberensis]|uniref:Zinc finger CCCH domain-containing protein 18-like n=1 Tax=Dioscorea zingiberensis TaxID=325984 RepID=A0A9D5HNM9_9LILI|nr:hypothetical protein J5N97_010472 [Dioscorea zingiberensis]